MIALSKAVIEVVQAAMPLPGDLTNEADVKQYLDGLAPGLAKAIVAIAEAVKAGKLGLIGAPSADEIRVAVADELEGRGIKTIDPALIEAIITIVVFIISQLRKDK